MSTARGRTSDIARIASLEEQVRMLALRLSQTPKAEELRVLVRRDVFGRSWWGRSAPAISAGLGTAIGTGAGALLEQTAAPMQIGVAIIVAVFGVWALTPSVDRLSVALFERAWQRRRDASDKRVEKLGPPGGPVPTRDLPSTLPGATPLHRD